MDRSFLERHRSWKDREAGIGEEFLRPEVGGARTVAVLTKPLGEAHDTGWVVCHSFGGEQMHLSRLEVMVARAWPPPASRSSASTARAMETASETPGT